MNVALIVAALVVLAVLSAMVGMYYWLGWTRDVEKRLAASFAPAESEVRRGRLQDQVNQRISRFAMGARLERQLEAADSQFTVAEYIMLRIGLTLLFFLVGWVIVRHPIGGLTLSLVGWMLPGFYLRRRQSKRAKEFADQLPDMLSMLVGSLRAGYGLLHALSVIEDEMPEPMSTEFGRVIRETALGYSLGEALDHLVERIDNDDLALIVTTIHIQNEVGGNLADVLETISKTIRDRIQLKGEIRAMTAQQRATGSILSGLPFAVGVLLMLINPEYMLGIFQPGWPLLIPAGAVVMIILGNIIMRMVTRIDV